MVYGDREIRRLRERHGIVLARLEGTAGRYGYGRQRDAPRAEAIAELHEISMDPLVLGMAAGPDLASSHEYRRAGAEVLAAAGADMEVAAVCAAEIRARFDKTRYAF